MRSKDNLYGNYNRLFVRGSKINNLPKLLLKR